MESQFNIIGEKTIDKGGSFSTRMDDTKVGYNFAIKKPILGFGPVHSTNDIWSKATWIENKSRSNGLANFAISWGILYTIFFLILVFIKNKKIYYVSTLQNIIIFIIMLIFFNSEPILVVTYWLTYYFEWGQNLSVEEKKQQDGMNRFSRRSSTTLAMNQEFRATH
jgi:hypothetical protein